VYIVVRLRVERELADAFVELSELDQALDDVLGLLHELEADLLHFDLVSGDPNYCEMIANNIQVYTFFAYDTG